MSDNLQMTIHSEDEISKAVSVVETAILKADTELGKENEWLRRLFNDAVLKVQFLGEEARRRHAGI